MSKQQQNPIDLIMTMMREVNSNEHRVSIPTLYIKLFNGDVTAALIAQECEFYSGLKPDGWFYMRQEDWNERYCLTRRDVDRTMAKLSGIVETEIRRAPDGNTAKYYRFNARRMFGRIYNYMRSQNIAADLLKRAREVGFAIVTNRNVQNEQSQATGMYESYKPECTDGGNPFNSNTTDHPPESKTLQKKTTGEKPTRQRDELFDVIASTCQLNPVVSGSTIAKVRNILAKAGYTVADVEAFGRHWWSWKERADPPTVWKLKDGIEAVKNGKKPDSPRRPGGRPAPRIIP